jgi:hypothetical protein
MNKLTKTFIYPVLAMIIIIVNVGVCYILTAFLAWIFNVELINIVESPMVLVYIVWFIGLIVQIGNSFEYVDKEL